MFNCVSGKLSTWSALIYRLCWLFCMNWSFNDFKCLTIQVRQEIWNKLFYIGLLPIQSCVNLNWHSCLNFYLFSSALLWICFSSLLQISQLNLLIGMLLGELSSGDRQKIMTICTIDVHARDIVASLIAQKVIISLSAFSFSLIKIIWRYNKFDSLFRCAKECITVCLFN